MIKERRRKINEANRSLSSVFWIRAFVMDGDGTQSKQTHFYGVQVGFGVLLLNDQITDSEHLYST